jgi:hypothetical protein
MTLGDTEKAGVSLEHDLAALGRGACADLLRVLTSPSHVRADVIRQFWELPGGHDAAELLMLCEEDDFKRAAVVDALRRIELDQS